MPVPPVLVASLSDEVEDVAEEDEVTETLAERRLRNSAEKRNALSSAASPTNNTFALVREKQRDVERRREE